MKKIFLIVILLINISTMFAQKQRNYVYMVDCTASMKEASISMWEPAKKWLEQTTSRNIQYGYSVVVPFQDYALDEYIYDSGADWQDLCQLLDKYIKSPHSKTGICRAWRTGEKFLNLNMNNYMFLLTDGKEEYEGIDALCELLNNFCDKFPNTHAFYVHLGSENQLDKKIRNAIENLPCISLITNAKGEEIPAIGVIKDSEITINTHDQFPKIVILDFSDGGEFNTNVKSNSEHFDVKIKDGIIKSGKLELIIDSKYEKVAELIDSIGDVQYNFDIAFEIDGVVDNLKEQDVEVNVINNPEKKVTINAAINGEFDLGKTSFYNSFLFWSASEKPQFLLDLDCEFNEYVKDDSYATFEVCDNEDKKIKDFELYYNDCLLQDNKFIIKKGESNVIKIVFNREAICGQRYLKFVAKKAGIREIDCINDTRFCDSDKYEFTCRAYLDNNWNPLAWALLLLGCIILAGLLLWFLLIKPQFYPKIKKVKSIVINSPYYKTIKIKGFRKVVFTNSANYKKQSAVNKFFTGEIRYEINDVWLSPLEFKPSKKGLNVVTLGKYLADPIPFTSQTKHDLKALDNPSQKIEVIIN